MQLVDNDEEGKPGLNVAEPVDADAKIEDKVVP